MARTMMAIRHRDHKLTRARECSAITISNPCADQMLAHYTRLPKSRKLPLCIYFDARRPAWVAFSNSAQNSVDNGDGSGIPWPDRRDSVRRRGLGSSHCRPPHVEAYERLVIPRSPTSFEHSRSTLLAPAPNRSRDISPSSRANSRMRGNAEQNC